MKTGVVNSALFHSDGYRIDPDMHLGEGVQIRRELHATPYELSTVGENASRVFYGNIFSRVFVKKPDHGVPYLAASDTVLSNLDTGYYLSKKQAAQLSNLMLKKDWILVTCSGTLGNVTYTNKVFEKYIATHDLIRVVPNDAKVNKGTLHAFLSSRYGYYQITQSQFGGVVKHVNDDQMKQVMVPVFPSTFQQEVDDLVQQSAKLREQAADALEEAHSIIDKEFSIAAKPKENKVAVKNIIKSHTTRLEGAYYTSANRSIYDYVIENYPYKTLKDCTERIFRPGIFKREYLSRGVTFLGGADIMMAIPKSDKKLSYKQVMKMPELQVQKGWILVTCGGTIGNTVYVDNQIAKCVVSQHVMRVVPKEDVLNGYLYAFLSSKIGHELITLFTYGSVIPSVESHHLEKVPIPVLDEEKTKHIDELVQSYVECLELSKLKETLAITMVEEEIEKWQSQTA